MINWDWFKDSNSSNSSNNSPEVRKQVAQNAGNAGTAVQAVQISNHLHFRNFRIFDFSFRICFQGNFVEIIEILGKKSDPPPGILMYI